MQDALKRQLCHFILFLMLISFPAAAGEPVFHPDGKLGHPSLFISGQYSSVTALQGTAFRDRGFLGAGIKIPVIRPLTLAANYNAMIEDSVLHQYSISATFYFSDPTRNRGGFNPDGPVGVPSLTAMAGQYFPDRHPGNQKFLAGMEMTYPVTSHFSVTAGGRYYEEDSPRLVDKYFGRIAWFLSRYADDAIYSNPDGPEGTPVLVVTGGGSQHGVFGKFDVVFPLDPTLTLAIYIKGERVPVPYFRAASAGFYINYYPGNGE